VYVSNLTLSSPGSTLSLNKWQMVHTAIATRLQKPRQIKNTRQYSSHTIKSAQTHTMISTSKATQNTECFNTATWANIHFWVTSSQLYDYGTCDNWLQLLYLRRWPAHWSWHCPCSKMATCIPVCHELQSHKCSTTDTPMNGKELCSARNWLVHRTLQDCPQQVSQQKHTNNIQP
jgi:hypothetical protein